LIILLFFFNYLFNKNSSYSSNYLSKVTNLLNKNEKNYKDKRMILYHLSNEKESTLFNLTKKDEEKFDKKIQKTICDILK